MNITRKKFLGSLVAGVAVATMHPLSAITIPAGPAPLARGFQQFVGRTFRVTTADGRGTIDVVLERYDEKPTKDGTHQFSLTFVAPGGERLAEGSYTVDQPQMGRFSLFVVPTGRDALGHAFYRSDFNLLAK
ncbi:MAG: hypothetical protein PT977_12690 [Acidobacteriota bacterium]|nr:hypothetical protein [Acidobacteriota bacterium]